MAIVGVGGRVSGISGAASTILNWAIGGSNPVPVDNYLLVSVSAENIATVDGASNTHSVTDSQGNDYEKVAEYTNSPTGVAGDGITVSMWLARITTQLATTDTITVTFTASITDKVSRVNEYSVGAGNLLSPITPQTGEVTGANGYGSLSFTGLASQERLYYRIGGKEVNTTTNIGVTAGFTSVGNTVRSRNNAAAVIIIGEARTNTSTGETSNPTHGVSGDAASIFGAFEETAGDQTEGVSAATATWSGITPTASPGNVNKSVTPAVAIWSGVTPTVGGTQNVSVSAGVASWSGVAPTAAAGDVAASVTSGLATWSGTSPSAAPGGVVQPVASALATWSGVSPTPVAGGVTAAATPAIALWSGVTPIAVPGSVAASVTSSLAQWSGVGPVAAPGAVLKPVTPATASWAGIPPSVTAGPVSASTTPALASWVGMSPSVAGGAINAPVNPAVATWSGVTPTVSAGGVTASVGAGVANWSGVAPIAIPGGVVIATAPAVATWQSQAPIAIAGGVVQSVTPAIAAWSGITPTVIFSQIVVVGPAVATWTAIPISAFVGVLSPDLIEFDLAMGAQQVALPLSIATMVEWDGGITKEVSFDLER